MRKGIEEYRKIHERSAERERKLVEQQTELERYASLKLQLITCTMYTCFWHYFLQVLSKGIFEDEMLLKKSNEETKPKGCRHNLN